MAWARRLGVWLIALTLTGVGAWHAVVTPLAPLTRLELSFDDLRQEALLQTHRGAHPDIVIVDIDEPSLSTIGHWPWGRHLLADLVTELLQRQQVAALAFDLVFPEPDLGAWPALQATLRSGAQADPELAERLAPWRDQFDNDQRLAAALLQQPVVLGYYLTADRGAHRQGTLPEPLFVTPPGLSLRLAAWTGYAANVPALAKAAPRAGFFNALPDADGIVRSVPAVALVDGLVRESLAFALLRQATGWPVVQPELAPVAGYPTQRDLTALLLRPSGQPARRLALDERGALRVPFRGRGGPQGGSFDYVSAADVLQQKLPPDSLKHKLVLIGSSAPGLADLRPTPINASLPGVEVHAHLLAGLLDGDLPQRPPWAQGYEVLIIALTLGAFTLMATRLSAAAAVGGAALLSLLLLASNLALAANGLLLPVASALLLGFALFVGLLSRNYIHEWTSRRSLLTLFNQYLPPERARELADKPGLQPLEAHNEELTILFCDLRGFSALGETLPPLALRELLNEYFSLTTRIIHAHDGTLDKFIGDAVMAFWGAPHAQPDHATRAVKAAMELAKALGPLNVTLARKGLPAVRYGIGLATGVVCVGDLGSRLRRSYTAVGDAVNLAARLEAMTRSTGATLLVSDTTHAACAQHTGTEADFAWVQVDEFKVRGREQAVTVFTPLGEIDLQTPDLKGQRMAWDLARQAARQQHVDHARARLAPLLPVTDTTPSTPSTPVIAPTLQGLAQALDQRLAAAEGLAA